MKTGTFMDIISVHYDKIKSLFKTRLYNIDMNFDEDSFNDAFIKCAKKFGNSEISYDIVIKYFWVAYLNAIKSNLSKERKIDFVSLDEEIHDCIDEDDKYATNIYNIVMDAIESKYSEEDMMIYSLYKYHNWSKEDLIDAGYDCTDIDNRIKSIHKFVKTYCKKQLKSLR